MSRLVLPPDVLDLVTRYRTAELSTLAKDGTPITWPVLPFYDEASGTFLVTTSIALDQKARNVRRDPRVSLFFSEPRGSGLRDAGAVLIQGDASAPDAMQTSLEGFEEELERTFRRQPASKLYGSNPATRALFDWYYMRLTITVTPRRVLRVDGATPFAIPRPIHVDA